MCSLFRLTFTVMSWGIWGRTFSRNSLNSGAFSRFSSLWLGIFRKWMSERIIGLTHWRRYSVHYRATSKQENNRTSVEWSINSSCSGNCAEVHELEILNKWSNLDQARFLIFKGQHFWLNFILNIWIKTVHSLLALQFLITEILNSVPWTDSTEWACSDIEAITDRLWNNALQLHGKVWMICSSDFPNVCFYHHAKLDHAHVPLSGS